LLRVGRVVFFSILVGLCCFRANAGELRKFGDWALSCPESEESCVLAQTVASKDHNWLATVRIALSGVKEGEAAVAQFLVPSGVHLASGLFATVAQGAPKQATYIRCNVNTCEAVMGMDAPTLSDWKRGRVAEVRYRPSTESPPLIFNVSLMGLTAGLKAAAGDVN
jgi:invasion protein IalB